MTTINKVLFNSHALYAAMQTVFKVMVNKPLLPVLECFKIDICGLDKTAVISGTDCENFLETSIKCEVLDTANFSFLIDTQILKVLKKLDNQPVMFEVKPVDLANIKAGNSVNIVCESDVFKYYTSHADDYPAKPAVNFNFVAGFNSPAGAGPDLLTEIKIMDKYRGKDELRINLMGTFFEIQDGNLVLTSTDANKLRTAKFKAVTEIETAFVMSKKACEILGSLSGSYVDIETSNNEDKAGNILDANSYCRISVDNTVLISRNIWEKYPNYMDVIPQDNPIECEFNTKDFIKKIDLALMLANKGTGLVRLCVNGSLTIKSEDFDLCKEYAGQVPCVHAGDDIEIGFNGNSLAELLKTQPEQAKMLFSSPNRAMVIKDDNATVLLMPMMLNN